jgi:hypothetical protein
MNVLISSCFNGNPQFALATYSLETTQINFVDLSAIPVNVHFRGISGLEKIPGGFVAGLKSNGPSKLLFLDASAASLRFV